jgi:hypothetical protein
MSPHLPLTPSRLPTRPSSAAEAGASILHLKARDPKDGRLAFDPAIYQQFLPRIHAATDPVINITTGGAMTMTPDQRLVGALDVCRRRWRNMGSMNSAIFPVLRHPPSLAPSLLAQAPRPHRQGPVDDAVCGPHRSRRKGCHVALMLTSVQSHFAPLFRPASDGLVKDEGLPHPVLELFTRQGK